MKEKLVGLKNIKNGKESHKENWKFIFFFASSLLLLAESHKENWKERSSYHLYLWLIPRNLIKRIERISEKYALPVTPSLESHKENWKFIKILSFDRVCFEESHKENWKFSSMDLCELNWMHESHKENWKKFTPVYSNYCFQTRIS